MRPPRAAVTAAAPERGLLDMPDDQTLRFATQASHAGAAPDPATGARGTVTPIASAYQRDGQTCRDFLASYLRRQGAETWLQGEAYLEGQLSGRAARAAGAIVVGIVNSAGSTLTRDATVSVMLQAGPEVSVAATKSYTSQALVAEVVALDLARLAGRPQLICQEAVAGESSLEATRRYLEQSGITGDFTWLETGFRNHNDAWVLRPSPARTAARQWLSEALRNSQLRLPSRPTLTSPSARADGPPTNASSESTNAH